MSSYHKWVKDSSLRHRLKEAILEMCSHESIEERLKNSKACITPLNINDFPSKNAPQAHVIKKHLYKFINDVDIEITATSEEICEYAKSLFELYKANLYDLSKYDPESFEINMMTELELENNE